MTVWLLVAWVYTLTAQSPVLVVPGIATEQECQRLGDAIVYRHDPEKGRSVRCVSYEAALPK